MSKTFTDEEVTQVRRTLALHRSMAACGEQPSAASEKEIQGAFAILDKPQPSLDPLGWIDEFGNFENKLQALDEGRAGVVWKPLYETPVSARDVLMELMEWVNHYFGEFPKQVLLDKINQIINERGL